ncbi:MAG: hypothetical protein IKY45_03640, partial [Clostridia bacterium]|nr:hypothetical protein [Clostridia bacterium]
LVFKGRYDMDTFFEQIITIKKGIKETLSFLGIWFLAIFLCLILLFVKIPVISSFSALLVLGVLFGAYKLCAFLNIEYEYIITNGVMDIDKIINKSSRKRMLSLDLAKTSRIEKYSPALLANVDKKQVFFACNQNDANAYLIVIDNQTGKSRYLIFAPDDRIKGAITKFIPKFLANSAFK